MNHWRGAFFRGGLALLLGTAIVGTGPGCASSGERASRDTVTEQVGVYPAPPGGIQPARVGIPKFDISGPNANTGNMAEYAADELTTLAFASNRFSVIERAQLEQLEKEQALGDKVREGEAASGGQLRGVEYLIYGKITNLRFKKEKAQRGWSVPIGGLGVGKGDIVFTTECGVDLRMVDPSSGEVAAAHFSQFKHQDVMSTRAVSAMGFSSDASAELEVTEDDRGKVLRLALDDALRKMLPKVDQVLVARKPAAAAAGTPTAAGRAPAAGDGAAGDGAAGEGEAGGDAGAQPEGAKSFCSSCGAKLQADAKFCGSCGTAVPQ